MADWIEAGKTAPDFTLPADDGSEGQAFGATGQPVVLYFYPRDNTPGCTREACAFRDRRRHWQSWAARCWASAPTAWPAT